MKLNKVALYQEKNASQSNSVKYRGSYVTMAWDVWSLPLNMKKTCSEKQQKKMGNLESIL